MIRRVAWFGVCAVLSAGAPAAARGEDAPKDPEPLEFRAFPTAALTRGAARFLADRGPYFPSEDDLNDEEEPLYGGEEEDRRGALSEAELIEVVKSESPFAAWEREGCSIQAAGGWLFVRNTRTDFEGIAGVLLGEADRALATTVVDVAVLSPDTAALREGHLAQGILQGGVRVLGFARVLVQNGGRAVARDGAIRAFLGDVDVEV